MRVDGLNSNYGVTKNGNPYKKSNTGKRIGRDLGLGYVAFCTYKAVKSGTLDSITTPAISKLAELGGKLGNVAAKYPKLLKYGFWGVGVVLAAGVATGLGKLAGRCVDKIVEAKRKRAADKAAA